MANHKGLAVLSDEWTLRKAILFQAKGIDLVGRSTSGRPHPTMGPYARLLSLYCYREFIPNV